MVNNHLGIVGLLCSVLLLSACVGEKTPQQVTEAFWQSVIDGDAESAVEYSTLTTIQEYDGFSRDWSGLQPVWGRVVIEGNDASIVTQLSSTKEVGEPLRFETFLTRLDDGWRVDYARTAEELNGGALANLVGQIEQLGRKVSGRLKAASDDLGADMERLGKQLEELSRSTGEQASESIERYGELLRKHIDELAESARRALEERERNLSDEDRRALREVVADLDRDSEELSEPTFQTINESERTVAAARQQLDGIDEQAAGPYKQQWRKWGEQMEAEMQEMLDELSGGLNS